MPLRKQKGNMYDFITHTWNPIRGECPHQCTYCYMRRWGEQPPLRLDEKDLQTDLGSGNFIFVGSSCDMWAEDVRDVWIRSVLQRCDGENKFLFQSKNPWRFYGYLMVRNFIFGTTIETNRVYPCMGETDSPSLRGTAMEYYTSRQYQTFITIEPILDFDLYEFTDLIKSANPEWVNIGADSMSHGLPEPPAEKIGQLIQALREFTTVKLKSNLSRIYKETAHARNKSLCDR